MIARWVAKLVGWLRWFPFTFGGLLIAAACVLSFFHYGFGKIDLILLGVGAVGLGIAAVSLIFTVLAAVITYRRVKRMSATEATKLECGYWAPTGFSLPSLWYVPFVSVAWDWHEPKARVRVTRKRGRTREEVFPERRGWTGQITRRFDIGDIFGLCKVSFDAPQKGEVRFMPWVGALKNMHVLRGMAMGDDISHPEGPPEGDRYDMRHYVAGDPIRFVLWKVFAKSRELVVRTPERAISHARQTAVYMVADEGDEPAAGAARVAVDVGAFGGDWVLGADGCKDTTQNKDEAMEILARSAHASKAQSGAGLANFLQSTSPGSMRRAVVFVPPRPGPWLARVAKAARTMGSNSALSSVGFIIGVDGIDIAPERGRVGRLMIENRVDEAAGSVATVEELNEIVKQLGHNVLIVDRVRGQIFTPTQLHHAA